MENLKIISLIQNPSADSEIIGESGSIKDLKNVCDVLSKSNPKILILGEKGTGKSLFARYLHIKSGRKHFYKINCFLLSQKGKFNLDSVVFENDSTLFFENFHLLSDEQKSIIYEYLNAADSNTGVIFSSEISFQNPFLSLININIPPLRNRKEDIFPISKTFIQDFSLKYSKMITGVSSTLKSVLENNLWKGNVDELSCVIERGCILCEGNILSEEHIIFNNSNENHYTENNIYDKMNNTVLNEDKSLKTAVNNFKKSYVKKILEEQNWNQTKTSKILDIQRTYLSRLLSELNVEREQ